MSDIVSYLTRKTRVVRHRRTRVKYDTMSDCPFLPGPLGSFLLFGFTFSVFTYSEIQTLPNIQQNSEKMQYKCFFTMHFDMVSRTTYQKSVV